VPFFISAVRGSATENVPATVSFWKVDLLSATHSFGWWDEGSEGDSFHGDFVFLHGRIKAEDGTQDYDGY
jgi:hypothetical protein